MLRNLVRKFCASSPRCWNRCLLFIWEISKMLRSYAFIVKFFVDQTIFAYLVALSRIFGYVGILRNQNESRNILI